MGRWYLVSEIRMYLLYCPLHILSVQIYAVLLSHIPSMLLLNGPYLVAFIL